MSDQLSTRRFANIGKVIAVLLVISLQILALSSSNPLFTAKAAGVNLGSAWVTAYGPEGSGYAITDSSGKYLITEGLKTGKYNLTAYAEGYVNKEIGNVFVEAGQEVTNQNFYLALSGGISGKITDSTSGNPIPNVMVFASSGDRYEFGWYAMTDSNGFYRMITNLPTGNYNVTISWEEGYLDKTVSNVQVTAGVETKGINMALDRSGIISGKITNSVDGSPLEGVSVQAYSSDYKFSGYATTDATGHYKINSRLGSGTYTVQAFYETGWSTVSNVNVVQGQETSNVDMTITFTTTPPLPSGIIKGKITDENNQPINFAYVVAEGDNGYGTAYTDENGNYVISEGLGTGTYVITASSNGYIPQSISDVNVIEGQVTSGINFQLEMLPPEQSGRISGVVQGDPNPLQPTSTTTTTSSTSSSTTTTPTTTTTKTTTTTPTTTTTKTTTTTPTTTTTKTTSTTSSTTTTTSPSTTTTQTSTATTSSSTTKPTTTTTTASTSTSTTKTSSTTQPTTTSTTTSTSSTTQSSSTTTTTSTTQSTSSTTTQGGSDFISGNLPLIVGGIIAVVVVVVIVAKVMMGKRKNIPPPPQSYQQ